jgi:sec-independent protein translocase protein TatA
MCLPSTFFQKERIDMGGLSPFHWLIIAVIVLLLFGNRLPQVMRSLGEGVVEFKKGLQGIEHDIKNTTAKIEENKSVESKPNDVTPS